ncbi:MAG: hypothetical protein GXY33_16605 [Phycisphaerae bacterium]|nr:hypothetical protein [Phycisphaerae bacterium]
MNEDQLQSPHHLRIRTVLRVGGPLIAATGFLFTIVGMASFFAAIAGSGFPRLFWCCFVGGPLMFLGTAMCMFGYLGAFQRYAAGETAPVAKDTINYMGQNTQPGLKAAVKAIAQGIREGQEDEDEKP